MFKGIGNIAQLMKQASTLPGKMGEMSEELKSKQVTGTAGGGMVTVEVNGLQQVLAIKVDPVLKEKNDVEMVIDLLPAAINDAMSKSKQLQVEAMQSVTGGISIPGLDSALKNYTEGPTGDSGSGTDSEDDA